MEKNPTLSIITICYNIKDDIKRTCESIVNQTWQDFEWIVVDGGSTDGTVEILKKYQNRINILISEPDKGIYNAMNKGIKLAHGEWLNFMNGGDEYASIDALKHVFKDKRYEENILQGNEERYNADGKLCYIWQSSHVSKEFFISKSLAHQSMFYNHSLFNKYGLYDEKYKYCADTELNLRLISAGEKVNFLNCVVAKFYLTGISNDKNMADIRRFEHVRFNNIYFTQQELIDFERKQEKQRKHKEASPYKPQYALYKLFNFIPLLSIEDK